MTLETIAIGDDEFFAEGGYMKDVEKASPEYRETTERIARLQALVSDKTEKYRIEANEHEKLQRKISLDEYIEAISKCQSRIELSNRYGVHDNYVILLKADLDKVASDFKSNPNYKLQYEYDGSGIPLCHGIEYLSTESQKNLVTEGVFKHCSMRRGENKSEYFVIRESVSSNPPMRISDIESIKERDRKFKEEYGDYSMSIQLHKSFFKGRDILLDILKYIKENEISCCLLGSQHWFTPVYFPSKLKGGEE